MLALVYGFSPAGWLAARHLGKRVPSLAVALSGVRLREIPPPAPPGPDWVRVRVLLSGVCGTDIAMLRGRTGPQLSPFVSFPAVPGHEVLGVAQDGDLAGRRVVLDPFLGCTPRGLPACPACAAGQPALCHRFADGRLAPGMLIGTCRDLPGGWSEEVVAHRSQLYPVPDGVDDLSAVLAEPLAVALHPLLQAPPRAAARVLVIGAGTIGLCAVAAHSLHGGGAHVVAVARHPEQRRQARALGAADVVPDLDAAARLAVERGWSRVYPGLLGVTARTGGYDRVVDAVGSAASLAGALRLVGAGGRIDLLGCSGTLPEVDLTWLWAHEVQLAGFCGYGRESAADGRHTIALALDLLSGAAAQPLAGLVTHRFPLEAYRAGLSAAFFHSRSGAIKVVLEAPEGAVAGR